MIYTSAKYWNDKCFVIHVFLLHRFSHIVSKRERERFLFFSGLHLCSATYLHKHHEHFLVTATSRSCVYIVTAFSAILHVLYLKLLAKCIILMCKKQGQQFLILIKFFQMFCAKNFKCFLKSVSHAIFFIRNRCLFGQKNKTGVGLDFVFW